MSNAVVLAPNYQAGRDAIAGFKKSTKARSSTKYTRRSRNWISPPSLPGSPALKPEVVFAFYPGGSAVSFVKQYDQAGLRQDDSALRRISPTDETVRGAQGKSALGIITSGKLVAGSAVSCEQGICRGKLSRRHGREPSEYALLRLRYRDADRRGDRAGRRQGR